jgi:hypothetical protein
MKEKLHQSVHEALFTADALVKIGQHIIDEVDKRLTPEDIKKINRLSKEQWDVIVKYDESFIEEFKKYIEEEHEAEKKEMLAYLRDTLGFKGVIEKEHLDVLEKKYLHKHHKPSSVKTGTAKDITSFGKFGEGK